MSGNSCSETYEGINVLEITAKPRLLLSALTKHSEGCRGGTDFFTGEYEGSYYGSWRQINLAGPTLRIGKRRAEGEYGGYHITPLTPGRYQYRNGHLVWVGK